MNRRIAWRVAAALALALAACDKPEPGPAVAVERGWMRAPVPGAVMTAAYLEIVNDGDDELVIDGASSPQFGSVTMHATRMVDGRMTMRPIESLSIAPGRRATLAPGGDHVMLGDARVRLEGLEAIELTLTNSGAPVLTVTLPVAKTSPWEAAP